MYEWNYSIYEKSKRGGIINISSSTSISPNNSISPWTSASCTWISLSFPILISTSLYLLLSLFLPPHLKKTISIIWSLHIRSFFINPDIIWYDSIQFIWMVSYWYYTNNGTFIIWKWESISGILSIDIKFIYSHYLVSIIHQWSWIQWFTHPLSSHLNSIWTSIPNLSFNIIHGSFPMDLFTIGI